MTQQTCKHEYDLSHLSKSQQDAVIYNCEQGLVHAEVPRTQDPDDELVWSDGTPLLRGRCDTCGKPCDDTTGDCTADPTHDTALEA